MPSSRCRVIIDSKPKFQLIEISQKTGTHSGITFLSPKNDKSSQNEAIRKFQDDFFKKEYFYKGTPGDDSPLWKNSPTKISRQRKFPDEFEASEIV